MNGVTISHADIEPRAAVEARSAQQGHEGQLRRFAEGAPALVGARTFEALAEAASELTLSLFGAAETYVALQRADAEIVARHGSPATTDIAVWAEERRSMPPASGNRLAQDRLAVTLTSRDGACRGIVAARLGRPIQPHESHLLDQVGVLVSVCADSLLFCDAAAKAVRARDDILAAVSHDLRTPLNNVRLAASLLKETVAPSDQNVVARIERGVVHMTHLVDDLVDMVHIEGGKIEVAAQNERVVELLEAARRLVAPQIEAQRLRLTVEAPAAALVVRADRHRTIQVLRNLLGNAVKFTPEGGEVTLRAEEDDDFVRFEVKDTGAGIPEGEADRVFARFWRSDPKKRRGLGLGLYISKGLVTAQGGRLWFESAPGKGSRFFFTLPKPAPRAA